VLRLSALYPSAVSSVPVVTLLSAPFPSEVLRGSAKAVPALASPITKSPAKTQLEQLAADLFIGRFLLEIPARRLHIQQGLALLLFQIVKLV
jgi:hypothetical protein